jgi:hypothetical protein
LDFDFFHKEYHLFPLILLFFYLIFLIFPFNCFYVRFRSGLWITFLRNIFPIGKTGVKFRDFIFGDILTSLIKPFASLVLSFCLLSSPECKKENSPFSCNRKTLPCLIVMLFPYIIRFFQCLNRLIYIKQYHHGVNMIKYCFCFSNVLFGWLYDNGKIKIKYN